MEYNYKINSVDKDNNTIEVSYFVSPDYEIRLNMRFEIGDEESIHKTIRKTAPTNLLEAEYNRIYNAEDYARTVEVIELLKDISFTASTPSGEKTNVEILP